MNAIQRVFGKDKAIIAMAHFPPLPGQPQYNQRKGVGGIVESLAKDLAVLAEAGFDGVMFCNEGDRPYRITAGPETTATMGAVIAQLVPSISIPFGVDILWDPEAAVALAVATGASFVREVFTGSYAGDFGIWAPDPAKALGMRQRLGADGLQLFFNITAEFAAPIAPRDIGTTARSVAFSSLADAICISGAITGSPPAREDLLAAKKGAGQVPVLANTGVSAANVGDVLEVTDGCIIGSSLKRDGLTWNEVDKSRVDAFMEAAAAGRSWRPRAKHV
ncbi:MAG: BtpA/SgcQ family protein [Acidimicrobiales bacterium]